MSLTERYLYFVDGVVFRSQGRRYVWLPLPFAASDASHRCFAPANASEGVSEIARRQTRPS